MRKKATFIVSTLVVLLLTGCGNKRNESYDERYDELYNLYVNLDERFQEQEKANETTNSEVEELSKAISTIEEQIQSKVQKEKTMVSNTKDTQTATQKENHKVENISVQDEKIQVSVLYNDASIPITAYDETQRDMAINNPYSLIVPECGQLRDISFIISGITVKSVYVVNNNFEEVENIKYSGVDNTYSFYYYMPTGGLYTFLITTVNGSHYYISVLY